MTVFFLLFVISRNIWTTSNIFKASFAVNAQVFPKINQSSTEKALSSAND